MNKSKFSKLFDCVGGALLYGNCYDPDIVPPNLCQVHRLSIYSSNCRE